MDAFILNGLVVFGAIVVAGLYSCYQEQKLKHKLTATRERDKAFDRLNEWCYANPGKAIKDDRLARSLVLELIAAYELESQAWAFRRHDEKHITFLRSLLGEHKKSTPS